MTGTSPSGTELPGALRIVSAASTHVGRVRATNEDSYLEAAPIYLVADGMGGHNAGEVASAIAVEEFEKLTLQPQVTIEQLGDALRSAGRRIAEVGGGGLLSAGTTVALVATMVIDDLAYWVVLNLGDSRVYRLSDEIFEQVSVDHSVVQELMDRGEITAQEAQRHPHRHMVTRALGGGPDSEPDYWLIPVESGDRMLICSDGLSGEVDDATIERVLRSPAPIEVVCEDLVELALAAGGHDNVTVVIVEAAGPQGAPSAPAPGTGEEVEIDEDTLPRPIPGSASP